MTVTDVARTYWRVPAVAVLAAILAFVASFAISPKYESSTRLLVHGRDATFLSSTGQDLTAQPGVVDSSLSQALLATYAGIATSRSVAVAVNDRLHLDQAPPSTAFYAPLTRAAAWAYRCGRAFVTSGFCAKVDPVEAAILGVQEGISAAAAGTNEGSGAGQGGSYVLEVTASGRSSMQAQQVTDTVADVLVSLSSDRFRRDAEKNAANLQAQVDAAEDVLRTRSRAVSDYQSKHNISAADAKLALSAATAETVRSDLIKAKADLADAEAQLASVEASLASVPKDQKSKQTIVTGRSTTETNTDSSSTVYNDLVTKQNELKAEEAGAKARVSRLQAQVDGARAVDQNGPIAELTLLQQQADLAGLNLKDLTETLQKALTTVASGSVDLSRLDVADTPTYPMKPKRYIYLALGLLIGALAGAVLTVTALRTVPTEELGEADEVELPIEEDERPTFVHGAPLTTEFPDLESIFASSSARTRNVGPPADVARNGGPPSPNGSA